MSAASYATIPQYFGRAFKLVVLTQAGETVTVPGPNFRTGYDGLRVRFNTEIRVGAQWSEAEVEVFNLNASSQQYLIKQGDQIQIFAGYQANFNSDVIIQTSPSQPGDPQSGGNNSSLIWSGKIFQATWERVGVVDMITTFRCVSYYFEQITNTINVSIGSNATQAAVIQQIAGASNIPIDQINTTVLSQNQFPRGMTLLGTPGQYLSEIASNTGLAFWLSPNGINMRGAPTSQQEPDLVYGPPYPQGSSPALTSSVPADYIPTLVGTPQQTQDGVMFNVLMDSRPRIYSVVQLSMVLVRQLKKVAGASNQNLAVPLDQDGIFIVIGIKHVGDVRGNDWTTQLTCVSKSYFTGAQGLIKYLLTQ